MQFNNLAGAMSNLTDELRKHRKGDGVYIEDGDSHDDSHDAGSYGDDFPENFHPDDVASSDFHDDDDTHDDLETDFHDDHDDVCDSHDDGGCDDHDDGFDDDDD
jgi:hypothetical protein